jgi:hypothetical protein
MTAGGPRRPSEVTVEVREDRARQVASPVRLDAWRAAEAPPDVEEDDASTERPNE